MNEMWVSSISADWSILSISIKSDLPIVIDLSIDKSILIFIGWLLRDVRHLIFFVACYENTLVNATRIPLNSFHNWLS